MSKNLGDIRQKIDKIDHQIHDFLMERAELVSSVAAAKKRDGLQFVQPAREAMMMRRLFARHEGVLPRLTIMRIWRELVGSVALLQMGFHVVVCAVKDQENDQYWDMARDYFGATVPAERAHNANEAIARIDALGDESFAVLPWMKAEEAAPWWHVLMVRGGDTDRLSIICAFPYAQGADEVVNKCDRALVVSRIAFLPSDDDVSFIGIMLHENCDEEVIKRHAGDAGLSIIHIYRDADAPAYLLEVQGYIDADHVALSSFLDAMHEQIADHKILGGYPVVSGVTA